MRNLLAFFAFALLAFAALGWYLDWYKISSDPAPSGHQNVTIDFNRFKIADDVQKGVQKGEEKLQGVMDNKDTLKPDDAGERVQGNTPGTGKQLPNE